MNSDKVVANRLKYYLDNGASMLLACQALLDDKNAGFSPEATTLLTVYVNTEIALCSFIEKNLTQTKEKI